MECLARIVQAYYEYMEVYMAAALFKITLQGMQVCGRVLRAERQGSG